MASVPRLYFVIAANEHVFGDPSTLLGDDDFDVGQAIAILIDHAHRIEVVVPNGQTRTVLTNRGELGDEFDELHIGEHLGL